MKREREGPRREEKFQILFTEQEIQSIDDWRYSRRVPSRAEAVRRLVEKGLEASANAQQPGT